MKRQLSWIVCVFFVASFFLIAAGAQDISQTNAPIIVSGTNVPLIMKGLYGGRSKSAARNSSEKTATAVMRCLRWLQKVQNEDGSWGGAEEPTTEATGLALRAFLASGETPSSEEFGKTVGKAISYLTSIQQEDGSFKAQAQFPASEHAIASWALCEAYAMTRIPNLSNRCEKAVAVILKAQRPSGLWSADYEREKGVDDIEASVWQILALKSAVRAGLNPKEWRPVLQAAGKAMAPTIETSMPDKKQAPAIYSLQIVGYGRDKSVRLGLAALAGATLNWESTGYDNPVYQWHFINQATFMEGRNLWSGWNKSSSPALVTKQVIESVKDGRECGYWVSPGKGEKYGKIYSTALCCMMLQVYYAHAPFSKTIDVKSPAETDATNEIAVMVL